ncbi:MAG: putative hydrolase [Lentisphaerae bacterium ADurb.Bin242]|nr:MAG: putative hydrolase [Lentisphaerae bacterium ADurb.Bin242]
MILKQDLHIHTHCSCDSASAQIVDVLKAGQQLGFTHFGISDHLHTRFNLPDIEVARKEFLALGPVPGFHFGLEITCVTQWECEKIAKRDYASCFTYDLKGHPFQTMTPIDGIMYGGPANGPLLLDITAEEIERLGIEYIIGGVHKPNYTEQAPRSMINDFFNQMCFMLNHEFVDIIAHPWDGLPFWSGYKILSQDPKDLNFEAYRMIPSEYWDELAKLFIDNHKLAELNAASILNARFPEDIRHLYMNEMAAWREKGVKFTYGSDLHAAQYDTALTMRFNGLLQNYGFTKKDFYLPPLLKDIIKKKDELCN